MARGLAFSSLSSDRGSLGPIGGLTPWGIHQGLLPGSSPLGLKGGRKGGGGEGGEGVACSTPKSIGDGVYVLCHASCNSGLHMGVIPTCIGVGYESKRSLNLGLQ